MSVGLQVLNLTDRVMQDSANLTDFLLSYSQGGRSPVTILIDSTDLEERVEVSLSLEELRSFTALCRRLTRLLVAADILAYEPDEDD